MAGLDLSISSYRHHQATTPATSLLSPGAHGDMDTHISPSKSADDSPVSTPRKNKRKSSSPKRRSDFSIKRFCPDPPRALSLESDEFNTRPGYGEHPPSTPETSASSSTPSPPDATELLRVPQLPPRYHLPHHSTLMTSPSPRIRSRVTSPPRSRHSRISSPPRCHKPMSPPPPPRIRSPPTSSEQTIHERMLAAATVASGYPGLNGASGSASSAFLGMNPLLIQHMVGLQQHGALPLMLHPQLASAATAAATAAQQSLPVASPHHASAHAPVRGATSHATATSQQRSHGSSGSAATAAASGNQRTHVTKHSTGAHASKQTGRSGSVNNNNNKLQSKSQSRATASNKRASHNLSTSSLNDSSEPSLLSTSKSSELTSSFQTSDNDDDDDADGGKRRKNYKNMTRERRIEANARERTRVHTISAAFETLRHTVPSFSHNQRLSKLAILRIACSYISSLATLAGHDYSGGGSDQMAFEESVNQCTKTIQNEGRAKRRH